LIQVFKAEKHEISLSFSKRKY